VETAAALKKEVHNRVPNVRRPDTSRLPHSPCQSMLLQRLPFLISPIAQTGFRPRFAGMVRGLDAGLLALVAPLRAEDLPIGSRAADDIPKIAAALFYVSARSGRSAGAQKVRPPR
jgi:hypothetical protein